jgi:enoyl-CoA hydratase
MTGKRISAEAAEKFRIVDIVVETGTSMEFALEYAEVLKKSAPKALKATKEIIAATSKYSYDEVRKQQHAIFPDLWFSKDHKEAEAAFSEKRSPIFTNK